MNRRAQLACLAGGPLLALSFLVGSILIGRFLPPFVAPGDSAQMVAQLYVQRADFVRAGAFITILGMTLLVPYATAIAVQFRRTEGGYPILTYVQVATGAVCTSVVICMCMFWAVAAYRPGDTAPDVTRALNDIAYFFFVFMFPPFSLWVLAIGAAILMHPDDGEPVYPRWVAYFNIWTAMLFIPAGMIAFFKRGPFAWNGILALYMPLAVFFVWMAIMCVYTVRNVNRGAHYRGADAAPAIS